MCKCQPTLVEALEVGIICDVCHTLVCMQNFIFPIISYFNFRGLLCGYFLCTSIRWEVGWMGQPTVGQIVLNRRATGIK